MKKLNAGNLLPFFLEGLDLRKIFYVDMVYVIAMEYNSIQ